MVGDDVARVGDEADVQRDFVGDDPLRLGDVGFGVGGGVVLRIRQDHDRVGGGVIIDAEMHGHVLPDR